MRNKIGINEYRLKDIEKKLVNLKLNILDETFTFNENEFDFNYLIKLNEFLFNDFYHEDRIGIRYLTEIEKITIDNDLKIITRYCLFSPENIKEILFLVEEIWDLQPFVVGNTRTMLAFLKVIDQAFLLDLDVDVNKDIKSNPNMFRLNNIVNQKRLTKNK